MKQYPLIPENDENEGLDKVVVPSTSLEQQNEPRNLMRENASMITKVFTGAMIALKGEGMDMNTAYAENPSGALNNIAMAPSGSLAGGTLAEDPVLKVDEHKLSIRNQFKFQYAKLESSKGMSQIMQARSLLPALELEIGKAKDDFERKAALDLVFEVATIAGKHKQALFANQVLTPESDQFTSDFYKREEEILQSARANEMNAKASLIQQEIAEELNARKQIVEALEILKMNPEDADKNQFVGEDLFFERNSPKGLFYLAKGNNPLHRTLAMKMNDAMAWIEAVPQEMNAKYRPRYIDYAMELYLKNPDAYTDEQKALLDARLKQNATLVKAIQMRAPLTLAMANAGTPQIKEAAAAPQSSAEKNEKAVWINGLQMIPKTDKQIVSDGNGGVVFKGKTVLVHPFEADGEYDIACEYVEGDGAGSIVFIFPVGNTSCMLLKGPDFVALDSIKGVRAYKTQLVLPKGVRHTVGISVRKGKADNSAHITAHINGNLVIEHEGEIADISVTKTWNRGPHRFATGNHDTPFQLMTYKVLMKSGVIRPAGN